MNDKLHLTALTLALAAALGIAAPAGAADITTTTSNTSASSTSGTASTTTLSSGQSKVIGKTADTFTPFAGSRSNAESLATGLRTGSEITLTGTGTDSVSFTSPTKPMGYGNVSKALALSSQQLAAAGVAQPTPEQIQAAMMGGTITNDAGQQVEMQGVLQMRADGMGWGQIAHELGVKPGQGYRPAHTASGVTTAASTGGAGVVSAKGKQTATTSAGSEKQTKAGTVSSQRSSGSGIVTAGGGSAPTVSKGASHRAEAPTTAGGQSGGVVHAGGHGHGVVSAAGGSVSNGQGGGGGLAKGHSK